MKRIVFICLLFIIATVTFEGCAMRSGGNFLQGGAYILYDPGDWIRSLFPERPMIQDKINGWRYTDNKTVLWPLGKDKKEFYFIPNTPAGWEMVEYRYSYHGTGRIAGYSGAVRNQRHVPKVTVINTGTGKEGQLRIWFDYRNPSKNVRMSDSLLKLYNSYTSTELKEKLKKCDESAFDEATVEEKNLVIRAILSLRKKLDFDIKYIDQLNTDQLYDLLREEDVFVYANTYESVRQHWVAATAHRELEIRIKFQFYL
ncbi:MAG: hypothetical protein WC289_02625 [Patescibacteria group bacterium]|jgi:hypothetical protein